MHRDDDFSEKIYHQCWSRYLFFSRGVFKRLYPLALVKEEYDYVDAEDFAGGRLSTMLAGVVTSRKCKKKLEYKRIELSADRRAQYDFRPQKRVRIFNAYRQLQQDH